MKHFIFILLVFSSCQSDQSLFFTEIKEEYLALINSEYDEISTIIKKGVSLETKLKNYILEYPKGKHRSEIDLIIQNLEKDIADVAYRLSLSKMRNLQNNSYESYAQAIQSYNYLIIELRTIMDHFYQEQFQSKIQSNIAELESSKKRIQEEESDYHMMMSEFRDTYTISIADDEINRIKEFLDFYEPSLMKNSLFERIENLQLLKFNILSKESIESIQELNDLISACLLIESQLSQLENKNKIKTAVAEWNNTRDQVLRSEWEITIDKLKNKMKVNAIDYCNEYVHNFCQNVISSNIQNCERKDYLGKSIIICNYELQVKGGLFCGSIYQVIISAIGEINGDKQYGTNSIFQGNKLIRDIKVN